MENPDEIRNIAHDFDGAIEGQQIEKIISRFTDDCIIEFPGGAVRGKEGARRWIEWMFSHFARIRFEPVTIMVDGNTFFEEYVFQGTFHNGSTVRSRQAEVLEFEGGRIRAMRIFFDRMDFADALEDGMLTRFIVRKLFERFTPEFD
ncbi:MAG: nuclear transport factor 2 family protein [Methanomicrobiaceae archaeon]|nr:nuclear transport factor 2 family protein [Methanomicrobiaceae archaeon]